jgi:hypothetical protein
MDFQRSAKALKQSLQEKQSDIVQELYEPLWDELHQRLKAKGINIRGIWIADVAHQGQSGVLNESDLGNDRQYPLQAGYFTSTLV